MTRKAEIDMFINFPLRLYSYKRNKIGINFYRNTFNEIPKLYGYFDYLL